MSPIVEARLAELERISLKAGGHNRGNHMCAMEAAAWIAGESWSDHPECVCPTIGAFMRSWNDGLPSDAERDRLLKPFLPRIIGTAGSSRLAEARAYLALDWLVRVHTPTWLDLTPTLRSHAQALRALEVLRDTSTTEAAQPTIAAAWAAAGAAAWDAAWDAAGAAAWAAAWDAARAAARDAAWAAAGAAARDAAGAAARAAARDAAWAAAWAAARDAAGAAARDAPGAAPGAALLPTVAILQERAGELLTQMIELKDADVA